ncbi:uncharacterized protein LOC116852028 [Odontomachus brunneus]|uniref:uncharacterized protein LOC116852028 n=1 Tax=Odontomachus brunneus TaxID=486640 RepID=UPI0013F291E0|nr:uncharacterized protein LOC116852028 [Odontomachus brunneus]
MICVKSLQLDLNRILLLTVGLWPFERSKFVQLQLILSYGILITSIVFPLATFATTKCTLHLIVEVLSTEFLLILFSIKFSAFWFNLDTIKLIWEIIQNTYDELTDSSEVAILEKYGTIAKRYTYTLTLLVICCVSVFMFLPLWPRIIDVVWPANESRPHPPLQITMEYFLDHERYFYLFVLHINAIFCIGQTTILATGTIIIAYFQYICGMFKVASYRMEQVMIGTLKMSDAELKSLVHKRIIFAIDMHRKATKFAKLFQSKFEIFFFFLMITIVISISLSLYRIFYELSTGCDIEKLITSLMLLLSHYVYMFISNLGAQEIMDHNEHVFSTVYNVRWYTTPLHIQRIILFLLQRGTKTFYISLAGMFVGSLEGFSTLTSLSISYFTVVYSISCTLCSVMSIILLPLWPHFVGMFVYINNTRHAMKIVTEYFIDQDKYVYLLLVHIDTSLFIGTTVIVAMGTILLGYLKHACGMFRIDMICIETLYINLNRLLLLAVGLWPYQQSKLVQLQLILLFSTLISFILFQFASLVTLECTPDLLIKVLSSTLFFITLVIKYNSFRANIKAIRYLLELLQRIYNELQDENEIIIIRKYGQLAQRSTAGLLTCSVFIIIMSLLYIIYPLILDILWPLNKPRPRQQLQFVTEYFVDQEKYIQLITWHAFAAFLVGGVAMLATGTILMTFIRYACGMFQIASYRIEHAMIAGTAKYGKNKDSNLIYESLIYAVDIHRKAMQFSNMSVSKFKVSFFLLIIIGVLCGALNLFRISQIMMGEYNNIEISFPFVFIITYIMYLIIGCYVAQEITDHSNHVYTTVYSVQWYVAPLNIQKMILFLLERGSKVFTLNIGGFIVGSLESAVMVRTNKPIYIQPRTLFLNGLDEIKNAYRCRS